MSDEMIEELFVALGLFVVACGYLPGAVDVKMANKLADQWRKEVREIVKK